MSIPVNSNPFPEVPPDAASVRIMNQTPVAVRCPYCDERARCVSGSGMYPDRAELHRKNFYVCFRCDASVGCHPGTRTPLGRLADSTLRKTRQQSHALLDQLMKQRRMTRGDVYRWLATELNLPARECHIAQFDLQQCERLIAVVTGCLQATNLESEPRLIPSTAHDEQRYQSTQSEEM